MPSSQFLDDEYVIYRTDQQLIRYIIEFTLPGDLPSAGAGISQFVSFNPFAQVLPTSTRLTKFFQQRDEEEEDSLAEVVSESQPFDNSTAGSQPAGLMSMNSKPFPLVSSHVSARILDLIGEVVILQHYKNEDTVPIEAKYVFPLDEVYLLTFQ